MSDIAQNIGSIRQKIKEAQAKSPHAAPCVTLLAVTKTIETTKINQALAAGITCIGENRVQELLEKYEKLNTKDIHLIGHLQTNKVKYIVGKLTLLHSLDRLELAEEIEKRYSSAQNILSCLVQVNIAEETTKFGLKEDAVIDFIKAMEAYPHIKIKGLMTIGPLDAAGESIRPVFKRLRLLRDEIAALSLPGVEMTHLSMGMSLDYQIAVEEGATIVRLGGAIFGPRY